MSQDHAQCAHLRITYAPAELNGQMTQFWSCEECGMAFVPMPHLNITYDGGFQDGLKAYAHWHNGEQIVGTTGTKLSEAIENRRDLYHYQEPVIMREEQTGGSNDSG